MERKLSATERVIWMSDQVGSVNAVMTAHISGCLDELALRRALDLLPQRHPSLGTRVELRGITPFFVSENVPPIPLRVIHREDDSHWHVEAENELNKPLPLSAGPLLKVVLIKSDLNSELLLVCHHIIIDAKSGIQLLCEILDLAARIAEKVCLEIEPLAEHPPVEEMLPRSARGWKGMMGAASLITKQVVNLLYQRPRKLPKDRDALPRDRRARFMQSFLSLDETESLIARCHEEGTTVQGAICAAMLKATAEQIFDAPSGLATVNLNCASPVDLRPVLTRPLRNEIGNFVSMVVTTHRITPQSSFWELARAVRFAMVQSVRRGEPSVSLAMLDKFLPRKISTELLVKKLSKLHSAIAISNLGVLDIPERFGQVKLRKIHATLSTKAFPENAVATIATTDKRLSLNLSYCEPTLSQTRVTRLLETTMLTIREAATLPAAIQDRETGVRACGKSFPAEVIVKA